MDIDQKIFKGIYRLIKKLAIKKNPEVENRTVHLKEIQSKLITFGRLLTGKPIEIYTAEKEGGLNGNIFFLPLQFSHFDNIIDNANFYMFRVCYLSVQHDLLAHSNQLNLDLVAITNKLEDSSLILSILAEEYPNLMVIYTHLLECEVVYQKTIKPNFLPDLSYLYGKYTPALSQNKIEIKSVGKTHQQIRDQNEVTEMKAPAKEKVENLEIQKDELKDYSLIHGFEKIETIDEFNGNWRDFDSADDLAEHAEALKELDLKNTVRTDDPTHSVYQTEFLSSGSLSESKDMKPVGKHYLYDEWNGKTKAYKKKYCKVIAQDQSEYDLAYYQKTITNHKNIYNKLMRRFNQLNNSLENVSRMPNGEEPDLDVVVESFADIKMGKTPTENIYIAKHKRKKDISLLLLTDVSLSTDSYTAGQRILDVEKQALIIFSEVLDKCKISFQIDSFSSRTRNFCDYTTHKSFSNTWENSKGKIGKLEPKGYTRIGPAIRHATTLLAQEKNRNKWIILLSDGKPNDYDRYEGQYGIHDVKKAIKEAKTKGVNIFTLAIESTAKYYLPLMVGKNYRILPRPEYLADALYSFYEELAK